MKRKSMLHIPTGLFALLVMSLGLLLFPRPAAANPCPIPWPQANDADCKSQWEATFSQRTSIITYTVQPGDTMWGIAARFGLDVDTLRNSNAELYHNPDRLYVGQVVRILPFPGAIYQVKPGDTLARIARKWHVAPDAITGYGPNRLHDGVLTPGQEIVIPRGHLDLNIPPPALSPEAPLAWPLRGWISQGYSAKHRGVDIASSWSAPIYAAGDGVVVRAGWLYTGYGFSVIINHGNGLQTLYGHMTNPIVHVGDRVRRGQQIGEVGSTGNSTGPHVHFEVRKNHVRVNPFPYLPALPPH